MVDTGICELFTALNEVSNAQSIATGSFLKTKISGTLPFSAATVSKLRSFCSWLVFWWSKVTRNEIRSNRVEVIKKSFVPKKTFLQTVCYEIVKPHELAYPQIRPLSDNSSMKDTKNISRRNLTPGIFQITNWLEFIWDHMRLTKFLAMKKVTTRWIRWMDGLFKTGVPCFPGMFSHYSLKKNVLVVPIIGWQFHFCTSNQRVQLKLCRIKLSYLNSDLVIRSFSCRTAVGPFRIIDWN